MSILCFRTLVGQLEIIEFDSVLVGGKIGVAFPHQSELVIVAIAFIVRGHITPVILDQRRIEAGVEPVALVI